MNTQQLIDQRIRQLAAHGISEQGITVLQKFWAARSNRLLIDRVGTKYSVDPRLAIKMESAGLVVISKHHGTLMATLTDEGRFFVFDLFNNNNIFGGTDE